ncbi:hypothetical protein GCM10007387_44320 [Pseudoduganella albidiflava]|uniref:Uncharacterized protein n=1 Tax=Pseudoduganella albidiflava TaxID=321983 RepID=A0AA88C7Y5_9BURK|nr:hypothetical protein GCM10007387_44320 [Pseudoduganella albidiflava]
MLMSAGEYGKASALGAAFVPQCGGWRLESLHTPGTVAARSLQSRSQSEARRGSAASLVLYARGKPTQETAEVVERIEGKDFGVQQLVIDGRHFARCKFSGAELTFSAKA